MDDFKQFNELLDDVRGYKMPRHPVNQLFNLTFKQERPVHKLDKAGGLPIVRWDVIKMDDLKGALDDCPMFLPPNATHALYCSAAEDIQFEDKITLLEKDGGMRALKVHNVKNPMMQNEYLIVYCGGGY